MFPIGSITFQGLTGRSVIYTDEAEITDVNVRDVLNKALTLHNKNSKEIDYLYRYYKGEQPIIHRTKEIRPEINNIIVENRANEIVTFKVAYLVGAPIQYVNRGKEEVLEDINKLNEFVFAEDKATKDKELAEWFTICGTGYRIALPDPVGEEDESPFEIYTLDPRNTFVVYSSKLGQRRLMGCMVLHKQDGGVRYCIYTDSKYYEIEDNEIMKAEDHMLGRVPIIEYPANMARLGAFEIVLPLLDELNMIASNRMDGIEQFIQSLLVIKGADIDGDEYRKLIAMGGLKLPAEGDANYITQELNQTQTQAMVDYCYDAILTICGMPNRNGGSSTSDTGSAVIFRDGWSSAEARAKDTETTFKLSEKEFLRLILHITNTLKSDINLKLADIDIRFTRQNYENIQEKSQVLTTMLNNDKIHPRLAFQHCGMFSDPELAYTMSKEYAEEKQEKDVAELERFANQQTQLDKEKVNNDDVEV